MNPEIHLSEAEFYEELDRPEGLAAEEHLANCPRCRAEVDAIRDSLTALQVAATSLASSEFQPRLELRQPGMGSRMLAWPLSVAAATVLFAASLSLVHRPATVSPLDQTAAQAAVQSAPADTDDALLDGIDRDLSTSVAPSLAPLDVSATEAPESAAKIN